MDRRNSQKNVQNASQNRWKPRFEERIFLSWIHQKKRLNAHYLLRKFESTTEIPVFVTQEDLGYNKVEKDTVIQGNPIWGLALQPVEEINRYTPSAVSTYRMKRASRKKRLCKRLQKVILHEVGHSLTLSHCQRQKTYVMVDFGSRKTSIDKVKSTFCAECTKQIEPYLKGNWGLQSPLLILVKGPISLGNFLELIY